MKRIIPVGLLLLLSLSSCYNFDCTCQCSKPGRTSQSYKLNKSQSKNGSVNCRLIADHEDWDTCMATIYK